MIYLDSAATTQIAPEVLDAMMPYLKDQYGNAGATYKFGRTAAAAIQKAREQVAGLFGCTSDHVIFTSGGSEGNNMVFRGVRGKLLDQGKSHVLVSAIEHDSVLKAAKMLTKDVFDLTYINPNDRGVVPVTAIESALRWDTGLISVMYVNNETGAINDVRTIGQVCKAHSALFHVDCVQAAGQFPIEVEQNQIDFATISSHKIHGPKGVGALYIRELDIDPLICGGSEQEFGLRGGTENVPGIVGFGAACEIAASTMRENMIHISALKQNFYTQLLQELSAKGVPAEEVYVNGAQVIETGKVLNLRFEGADTETLLLMLDTMGVCASAGSACSSHEIEPSHVLTAMGLSKDEVRSSIRFSFSKYNTDEEIQSAAQIIASCVFALRGMYSTD